MGVTPGWSAGRSSATRVRSGAIAKTSIVTSGRPGAPRQRRSSNSRDAFLRSWKMKATDATMIRLKPVDIVIVGGGFTGLTMAKELSTRTNLTVLVLERGRQRTPMEYAAGMDHIDFAARFRMMQNIADETVTHRHTIRDRSVPVRQYGSFLPGTGVGGAGEHWAGHSYRFTPEFFRLRGHLRERFGAARLPATLAVQDWGVTYDELEPHYWRAERMLGVGGKAGNLRGRIVDGGDPFEGPRQREFPLPPCKSSYFSALFSDATRQLGFHPFVTPSALLSEAYTNPDGIARPACEYCGYCSGFGCMVGAKAQPTNTILPVLARPTWLRVAHDELGASRAVKNGRVTGVHYSDDRGNDFFQPATIVVLASWILRIIGAAPTVQDWHAVQRNFRRRHSGQEPDTSGTEWHPRILR